MRRSMSTAVKRMYKTPLAAMPSSPYIIKRNQQPSIIDAYRASLDIHPGEHPMCKFNFFKIEREFTCTQQMLTEVLDNQKKLKQKFDFIVFHLGSVVIVCPMVCSLFYCMFN